MAASESSGKITKFVVASCVIAAMGGVSYGYNIGVSGGVMSMGPFLERLFPKVYKLEEDRIRKSNHYCLFNNPFLTSFTSCIYATGFFAYLLASSMPRSRGHNHNLPICLGGVFLVVGSSIASFAQTLVMLLIARVLLGIGIGIANQSVPLYIWEITPAKYRGAVMNGFQLCIGIGYLAAKLTNLLTQKFKEGWRISLSIASFPSLILAIGSFFLPETPNSIMETTGDVHKAELMLRRIHGTNDVQDELAYLVDADTDGHGISKLLHRQYRHELVMAFAIPFVQQVTGINVIAFYGPVLFRTVGFGESDSLMWTLLTGTVGTASTFLSMFAGFDGSSRKTLFWFGGGVMFVTQFIIGATLKVADNQDGVVGQGYRYVVLFMVCLYVVGFGWSWGPLGGLVPCEIFPMEIRSEAQTVTVAMSFLFTFAVAQSVPPMLCKLGAGLFFFFGVCVMVVTFAVQKFRPVTKNVTSD